VLIWGNSSSWINPGSEFTWQPLQSQHDHKKSIFYSESQSKAPFRRGVRSSDFRPSTFFWNRSEIVPYAQRFELMEFVLPQRLDSVLRSISSASLGELMSIWRARAHEEGIWFRCLSVSRRTGPCTRRAASCLRCCQRRLRDLAERHAAATAPRPRIVTQRSDRAR
jgi:hypothetical protein